MFKKRGQVSVFVMVAIVVFVAFAFVFAVGYAISKGNLESQVKKTAAVSDLIDSLKNHISSCMKSSADKALLRIGEQGGFIYEEEGGSSNINSVVFEEIDNTRRAYWLLKNSWDQPPGYPTSENNLGFMQVPLLQKEDVPKGAGVIQRYPLVKEEMLLFIKNDFKQCINLSIFREEGMSIDAKEPKFEIILADSGTNFYIDYPLDVSMGDYSERISKIPAYKSEISLKRMYEIARNVIYEDKTNLLFPLESITVNEYRYNPLYPAVAISVIPGKDYDIIKLTDLKRKIEGKQYELIFLRQNRNPVLKYIPEINGLISSPISVSPLAFDPDEDDFNITIEKWKIELGNVVFVPTRIIVYETFIPQPEDVGVYYYNITVTDSAGLSDWQNGIRATITCKYIDIKTEQAARKPYGNWSVSGKEYTYNPNCCDSYNNLFFTSSLYNELGDYLCSCTENGDCIIPGATPTPTPATGSCTKDFCNGNRASHCSTAGLVEYETQCVNGCVDGKCACIGCGDEGCYASGGCKPETSCPCVYGGSSPTCCL